VRILASIDNPYIISYKDAFIDDNSLCIVMEYAQGGDLEVTMLPHSGQDQGAAEEAQPSR